MAEIKRRQFLATALGLLAAPCVARAQALKRLPVLGILNPGSKSSIDATAKNLLNRLRELGWIEGKTLLIEWVHAEGHTERLPELAASLVAKNVDVIWTNRTPGPVAAVRATQSIPIVFLHSGYPVELGIVESLAKPGRNATGVAWFVDPIFYAKRFELLRELAPGARRVAWLVSTPQNMPTVAGGVFNDSSIRDKIGAAIGKLGFEVRPFPLSTAADLEPALSAIAKWAPDALVVQDFVVTVLASKRIVEFARSHRLIGIYEGVNWAQTGGLASYGVVTLPDVLRSAEMVDRILRGAKPADIPVELPTRFELVLNMKTATALGLKLPQSLLLRADRVIE